MLACVLSLFFHALVLGADRLIDPRPNRPVAPPPSLQATLMPPPLPAPVLIAPEAPRLPPAARPTPQPRPAKRQRGGLTLADTAALASRQIAAHLYYPPEAVARGLEGEAQVLLFLDESGDALAARVERSSGHAILDDAAVLAARAVRSLPEGVAREVLLPVRFRLR